MGACSFIQSRKACSALSAFLSLVSEAEYEHGHSPYNGTISTCKFGNCTLKIDKQLDNVVLEEIHNHILSMNYGRKWTADYVEVNNGINESIYYFYGFAAE